MMDRGTGDLKKKEDKYLSPDEIVLYLESLEVGPGKEAPIRMFSIVSEDYELYTMCLTSTIHPNGRRDYLSNNNIYHLNNFILTTGRILKLM